mmetsp:Transcript_10491/g.31621  ORF Transcript_10491/g.31621 Transcript_10491/m.31621 type:complete len:241 (+) Transcript_10491:811-1533(+)
MSYGVLRTYNFHFTDPHPSEGYLVRIDTTQHSSFPFSVQEFSAGVPTIRLQRQSNTLLAIPFYEATHFSELYSLLSNQPLDLNADLQVIQRHEPIFSDVSLEDLPTLRTFQQMHSSFVMRSHLPAMPKLRLCVLCGGVFSERALQNEKWFRNTFEVCLICELPTGLLEFAQRAFPHATAIADVTRIPQLVESGKLKIEADVGFATFECQSETSLQQLNASRIGAPQIIFAAIFAWISWTH